MSKRQKDTAVRVSNVPEEQFDDVIESDRAPDRRSVHMRALCHTQEEIAAACDVDKAQVSRICCDLADLPKLNKSSKSTAEHATDFDPPVYNIWKQQKRTDDSNHFMN